MWKMLIENMFQYEGLCSEIVYLCNQLCVDIQASVDFLVTDYNYYLVRVLLGLAVQHLT